MPRLPLIAVALATLLLAGCDMIAGQLGIESPEKVAAARDADDRAIGGACRHAGRAIEDCYVMNKKADKAAVFAGWRDMNDYMRENKIDAVPPVLAGAPPAQVAKGDADTDDDAKPETVADKPERKPAAAAAKPRKPSNS
ncbi:MAG TPA: hypothetical protein VGM74_21385 [Burkholderiaceae bacterium]|jgi:hypothetical protein